MGGRTDETGGVRLVLIAFGAIALYTFLWPAVTGDMRNFLLPWLDTLLARGRIGAFAEPFSNYTPPYLYLLSLFSLLAGLLSKVSLIKVLSVVGTFLLALAAWHLLRVAGMKQRHEAALWLLLLPSVAVNAAGFGQCDAIWSAACLMALASAIERRPVAMLIWFGVAIAFKAQAVFLAPFILQRLLQARVPLYLWALPGLVFALAMLPAALVGWPAADLATIYLRQTQWGVDFISNAANPWSFVQLLAPVQGLDWFWAGYLAAVGATGFYLFAYRGRDGDAKTLLALALLSAMTIPFLLPKMHERFFFLADVLAFLLVMVRRDRRSLLIFLLVQVASMLALAGVLLVEPLAPMAGAVLILIAIPLVMATIHKEAGSDSQPGRIAPAMGIG